MKEPAPPKSEVLDMMVHLPARFHPRIEVLEPIDGFEAPLPRRIKATREIVAEAGLGTIRRVVAPALLHGLVLAAVVAACGILAYRVGWADDRQPPSGVTDTRETPALVPVFPEGESKEIRDVLWGRPDPGVRPAQASGRPAPSRPPRASPRTVESRLAGFYRAQGKKKREIVPRTLDAGRLPAAPNIRFRTVVGRDGVPLATPRVEVRRVALLGERSLDPGQVRRVVRRHHHQVRSCLERQLKRDSSVEGKLTVSVTVSGEGRVTRASIDPPRFRGTFLEGCLLEEVHRWTFPNPAQKPCQVKFPLLLVARSG